MTVVDGAGSARWIRAHCLRVSNPMSLCSDLVAKLCPGPRRLLVSVAFPASEHSDTEGHILFSGVFSSRCHVFSLHLAISSCLSL